MNSGSKMSYHFLISCGSFFHYFLVVVYSKMQAWFCSARASKTALVPHATNLRTLKPNECFCTNSGLRKMFTFDASPTLHLEDCKHIICCSADHLALASVLVLPWTQKNKGFSKYQTIDVKIIAFSP